MSILNKNIIIPLFIMGSVFFHNRTNAQNAYPYDLQFYSFISYQQNVLHFEGDSSLFNPVFEKLANMVTKGEGQVKILHLGDSHIQADIFSGRMRERLQTLAPGLVGGRGFVFPYTVAKTNNPENYKVLHDGKWDRCRNVEKNKNCKLGLSGISVSTNDTTASFSLALSKNHPPVYDFNRIVVFHETDSLSFQMEINGLPVLHNSLNDNIGFTEFVFDEYSDTLHVKLIKTEPHQNHFTLHGISLETSDPGVVYHAAGINGANVNSFRMCNLFTEHLEVLSPDLIIISLGTNDGYVSSLDSVSLEMNYSKLIDLMRTSYAEIPVILTVPADNYRYGKTPNPNNFLIRNIIFRLAETKNCAVWDLFTVMGGYRSINMWHKENLAAKDKLHFSKIGYVLQGDLLFTAFLKAFDNYLDKSYVVK